MAPHAKMSCFSSFFRFLLLSFHSFLTSLIVYPPYPPRLLLEGKFTDLSNRLPDLSRPFLFISFTFHQSRRFSDGKSLGVEHVNRHTKMPSTAQQRQTQAEARRRCCRDICKVARPALKAQIKFLDAITLLLLLQKVSRGQFGVETNGLNREDFRAEQSVFVCRPCSGRT